MTYQPIAGRLVLEVEPGAPIISLKFLMIISHRLPKPPGPWFALLSAGALLLQLQPAFAQEDELDQQLIARLQQLGFTGKVEASLEQRLGRPVDPARADLGRLLWFDTIGGLNNDNTCAGCHSPTRGFGDTQSIAIGVENNGIVGPDRSGPRNQRRTPISPSEDEFNSLVDFVRQGLLDKRAEPERFRKLVPAQRKNAKLFNV